MINDYNFEISTYGKEEGDRKITICAHSTTAPSCTARGAVGEWVTGPPDHCTFFSTAASHSKSSQKWIASIGGLRVSEVSASR